MDPEILKSGALYVGLHTWLFFLFPCQSVSNFWKIGKIYKNGDNLKILIEIFCQKLIVSNAISAILNNLESKIFII